MHFESLHSPGVQGSPAPRHIQSAGDLGSAAQPEVWEALGFFWFLKASPESLMCRLIENPFAGLQESPCPLHLQ